MKAGQILREPLLHFLLIGLALFLFYGHFAPRADDAHHIVVSRAEVEDLGHQFEATWNRPPTAPELASLIDSHVHDEILYREGEALGLGRDDAVIKRRVRQKLEVMAEEQLAREAPTDADLEAYLHVNPDRFARPVTLSFTQIYFSAKGGDAATEREIEAARSALARGTDPARLGEPTLLPGHEEQVTGSDVSRDFGDEFAARLTDAPLGEWVGPLPSPFGLHLVRVSAREAAVVPPLAAVRELVAREWENDRRKRGLAASYEALRRRYQVSIEPAPAAGAGG